MLDEQAIVRAQLNSEWFADRAPRAIYAILLDEGIRLCHWRTMYRLLHADAATRERRAIRRHPIYARPELLAMAPRQVWSWDITWREAIGSFDDRHRQGTLSLNKVYFLLCFRCRLNACSSSSAITCTPPNFSALSFPRWMSLRIWASPV